MTFTLRHINVRQPDPTSERVQTINITVVGADVVTFNEAGKDAGVIRSLRSFYSYQQGENAVALRRDRFVHVAHGARLVMVGGRRGSGRPGDHRRRGPSRNVVWTVDEERASEHRVLIAVYHGIARVDTAAKWRRALSSAALALVGLEISAAIRKYGVTNVVLVGDFNRIPKINVPNWNEIEVPTLPTFGRLRYDRIFRGGGAKVTNVKTFIAKSDHRGLSCRVTLGDAPTEPAPKPPPEEHVVSTSANGNRVLFDPRTDGSLPRLRKWIVPGTNRHLLLRDGSMGFLLIHFALWWHEVIGRLDAPGSVWDEWGWAVRPIRGKTEGYSNHASGTAEDLDATRHPIGVSISRTFSRLQIVRIRARIAWYRGCLAWGGDWRRPDGMHVEIAAGLDRCERRARALMKTKRGKRILAANPGAAEVILS